jgi:hypothetical protein
VELLAAKEKLDALYRDEKVLDAIVTVIGNQLDQLRGRLSYDCGGGDFYARAERLIEASGGVIALEELRNVFCHIPQDIQLQKSPPDVSEQA